MAQIFRQWTNSIGTVGTAAVLLGGTLATFVVWYWFAPAHTDVGYAPVQPVPYSHKLHAGEMQMDCRYCHPRRGEERARRCPLDAGVHELPPPRA